MHHFTKEGENNHRSKLAPWHLTAPLQMMEEPSASVHSMLDRLKSTQPCAGVTVHCKKLSVYVQQSPSTSFCEWKWMMSDLWPRQRIISTNRWEYEGVRVLEYMCVKGCVCVCVYIHPWQREKMRQRTGRGGQARRDCKMHSTDKHHHALMTYCFRYLYTITKSKYSQKIISAKQKACTLNDKMTCLLHLLQDYPIT